MLVCTGATGLTVLPHSKFLVDVDERLVPSSGYSIAKSSGLCGVKRTRRLEKND